MWVACFDQIAKDVQKKQKITEISVMQYTKTIKNIKLLWLIHNRGLKCPYYTQDEITNVWENLWIKHGILYNNVSKKYGCMVSGNQGQLNRSC